MQRVSGSWIFIIIMILIDLYVFQAVKVIVQNASFKLRFAVFGGYWAFSAVAVATIVLIPFFHVDNWNKTFRTYFFRHLDRVIFVQSRHGGFPDH